MGRDARLKHNPQRDGYHKNRTEHDASVAIHEARHAVVGMRLGLELEYVIVGGAGATYDGKQMPGGAKFGGAETREMLTEQIAMSLANAAAEYDFSMGIPPEFDLWTAPFSKSVKGDLEMALGYAIRAVSPEDPAYVNYSDEELENMMLDKATMTCLHDGLRQAAVIVAASRRAIDAVANLLLANYGRRISAEVVRQAIASADAAMPLL